MALARWRCSCPICRLLVHPVLKRVGATGDAGGEGGGEMPARREVVRAPLSGGGGAAEAPTPSEAVGEASVEATPPAPQQVQVEIPVDEIVSKVVEGVSSSVSEANKVVLERIEQLEESIGKVRVELKNIVDSLQEVVVELREMLSEASNPFTQVGATAVATSPQQPRVEGLVRAARSIANIVSRAGLEVFDKVVDEYVKAGVIGEDEAKKLKALARGLATLGSRGVRAEDVIALLEAVSHG